MIVLTQILTAQESASLTSGATLSLPIDSRIKSRLKVNLDDGREAGLFLPRGKILRNGDILRSEQGILVRILAADEAVSTVYSSDPHLMARVCYHLGNRHVPLQIESNWVRYQHDHVLDEMVAGLGTVVTPETASFEPEAGAYGGSNSGHLHTDRHAHDQQHSDEQEHEAR
ncbi:urease accessory protein UreE [Photobacterium chitinilyticum]|uniref:Urease accessory protein UreE n=1 Tax=Photobacterium chitinilyticum TaxID=2485123 RepID=A0A444JNE6_9GAMM|nr:urease accessory protein UreE [Photobacterium chitinilyticum]RWX54652.1 urease accessory protein UreE [Photobacterium chitinilyticum]